MQAKHSLSIFTLTPRLVQLGSLAALGLSLQGCVAARHYEEARSVAESETAAHGRTRARLEAALKRVEALQVELEQQKQALAQRESDVAQSKLDTTVAQKEKEAATMLVEQLRSELARTGDHLSSSAREKRDLQQTLLLAEQRLHSIEAAEKNLDQLVGATRDLALALGKLPEKGGVELAAKDGQIVAGIAADKLFTSDGDTLLLDANPLLAAVGKVSEAHPRLRVLVRAPAGAPAARVENLGRALRERGVSDSRLTLPAAVAEPSGEGEQVAGAEENAGGDAALPAKGASAPAKAETEKRSGALPPAAPAGGRYEIAFSL